MTANKLLSLKNTQLKDQEVINVKYILGNQKKLAIKHAGDIYT